MESARVRYYGLSRKLVIALDIGTTFSGAAYALLDPDEAIQIRPVTRYLNAPNLGSAKVPSTLYYDRDGKFCGVENGVDFQDNDAFLRVRWWKLMISPTELSPEIKDQMSTQLPKGKTIVDVFADFMRYLFDSTKELFISSDTNGELRWNSVSSEIELVLTHPNGWGSTQRTKQRTAAVQAGIVPDTEEGHSRVHFVTEGEASLNFCATHTQAGKDVKPGEQVLVIDAGGGTVDVSTFKVLKNRLLQVEELYEPKCLPQGGEFVTARARAMVQEKLGKSKFNTPEDLAVFSQEFDEEVKKTFSNDQATHYVKFGSPRDNDPKYGIKAGKLTLTGAQVSDFFEPSIRSIMDSIRDNQRLPANSFAFLVGGFATSPWLTEQLEKRLLGVGLKLCKPDTNTTKAVTVGAVSFYVDNFAKGVSKSTYGVLCHIPYNPLDPEHIKREHNLRLNLAGDKKVPRCFEPMLSRGTKVLEDREIRRSFCYVTEDTPREYAPQLILKYTGTRGTPQWMDIERDKFETVYKTRADLSTAEHRTKLGRTGTVCYTRSFDVILLVSPTELKVQTGWIDSVTGEEKRSDAVVISNGHSEWTT